MLIILKEPIVTSETDVLAVNFESFDTVNITKTEEGFQLIVIQHFDGHQTPVSQLHCPLGTFDSYDECIDLFENLVSALQSGKAVLDLHPQRDVPIDLSLLDDE